VFEDIVQRGKLQARQPFGLTPGQISELQRAAAILDGVEKSSADERLSLTLNNMIDVLHRITAIAERLRRERAAQKQRRDNGGGGSYGRLLRP
jgi:hypothetical protein